MVGTFWDSVKPASRPTGGRSFSWERLPQSTGDRLFPTLLGDDLRSGRLVTGRPQQARMAAGGGTK
ncbi:MAG: hypothetical protein ACKN9U_05360, partial [Pirellulaceae bacterium]